MFGIFKKIISIIPEDSPETSPEKSSDVTPGKSASNSKSNSNENSKPSGALNLKPILEEDVPAQSSPSKQDKFPNFIHQGSPLKSDALHEVIPPSPLILPIAVAAAVIWIICVMALYFGFFGNVGQAGGKMNAAQWISVLMLAFIPAVMIGVIAVALRQLSAMSYAATQLVRAARTLARPDEAVIDKAKVMSSAVNKELDTIKKSFDTTVGRVSSLEEVLSTERKKLDASSLSVKDRFDAIGATLVDQHKALDGLADMFDTRMADLSFTLDSHKTELQKNTEMTEQKLHDARVSLETAVVTLKETTDGVRAHAVDATETLMAGHTEISKLNDGLQDRSTSLTESYKNHTAELSAMMAELREEQDTLAASLDERLAKMQDMSLSAKAGAESLKSASDMGRQTAQALAEATNLTNDAIKQRFTEMEEAVTYANAKAENISEKASRRVQDSLEHTSKEIARIEADIEALQDKLKQADRFTPSQKASVKPPELRRPKRDTRTVSAPLSISATPAVPIAREPADPAPTKSKPYFRKPISIKPAEDDRVENEEPYMRDAPPSRAERAPSEDPFDLVIQPSDEALDLEIPDPNADIFPLADETIRRTNEGPRPARRKTRRSSRWGWRDMLTGMDPTSHNAPVMTARDIEDANIVNALKELGLAPSAIVDDGCIIEACNARKASGEMAMSQIVAKRLGDPVRHLYIKFEENPNLKSKARAYTAQYKIGIDAIEDDREAIRMRLESDAGRAFLLCDAALNG